MKTTLVSFTFLTIITAACNGGGSVPAYTTTQSDSTNSHMSDGIERTQAGETIFQARCVACHGLGGNARNDNSANLQFSRLDSISIVQTIQNGRGAMPSFKDAIPDSDIGHLAVYVKSLRK